MAAANPLQSLQQAATCSICLEYFKDPVITQCGHNFCRPCASACSEGAGTALSCPQCRELCPQGDLMDNRKLQNIVKFVKQLSLWLERPPWEGLCVEHKKGLKLFCEVDETLICVICIESKEHRAHTVHPIKEAAEEYKPKLLGWLQPLRGELGAVQQGKQKEENHCKAMRNKLEAERRKIETEFQRLQQLLKEQEQTLLGRLEKMDKKIAIVENANIAKLSAKMSSLEALITEMGKKCEQPAEELLKDKLEAERRAIKTEFQTLQQLLKEQEQTLLRRLEEMDKKIATVENANIAKLSAEMSSLEALITEIEKKCEQPAEELLKDIRSTLNRCEHVMDEAPVRNVKKYKVLVTLDEDTAHDRLELSVGGRCEMHEHMAGLAGQSQEIHFLSMCAGEGGVHIK